MDRQKINVFKLARKSEALAQAPSYENVCFSIANDGSVNFLFAQSMPQRTDGRFVSVKNNSKYKAVSFIVDWHSGDVYGSEVFDLGPQSVNFHFVQKIGDDFLLLGARAHLHKDGKTDKNALILSKQGNKISRFCLGDGIGNCIVDYQNNIITGYFDEGVFGNNGWDSPVGASGLIKWSASGEKLW